MKRSTERILTTHVGSLARPDSLIPLLRRGNRANPMTAKISQGWCARR